MDIMTAVVKRLILDCSSLTDPTLVLQGAKVDVSYNPDFSSLHVTADGSLYVLTQVSRGLQTVGQCMWP